MLRLWWARNPVDTSRRCHRHLLASSLPVMSALLFGISATDPLTSVESRSLTLCCAVGKLHSARRAAR